MSEPLGEPLPSPLAVLKPGDTLLFRMPDDCPPSQCEELALKIRKMGFKAILLPCDVSVTVLRQQPEPKESA